MVKTFHGYMRATVFEDKRASFPAYVQPKHNGYRCLWDGETAWTREGKRHADHIQKMLQASRTEQQRPDGWVTDGELVLPRGKFNFQDTQSAVAAENENSGLLLYQVFDAYNKVIGGPVFSNRMLLAKDVISCETHRVFDLEEVEYWYEDFLERDYEGLIFRMDVPYKFGSAGRVLMKITPWASAEYICLGVWQGLGKNAGTPTYRLQRPDMPFTKGAPATTKNSFGAVPAVDYDKKRELWERDKGGSCIGKMYQVKFKAKYDSGVPQFPVGLGFREVDGPGYE